MPTVSINRRSRSKVHPQIFGLLVACASMTMMFMGLMSAYIVREAAGKYGYRELFLRAEIDARANLDKAARVSLVLANHGW